MTKQLGWIATGAGLLWAIAVIIIGTMLDIPPFSRVLIAPYFFLAPGLVLIAMVVAHTIRGLSTHDPETVSSGSAIDAAVVRDTVNHAVLALSLWPALSFVWLNDGLGLVMSLSVAFAIARILFWIGAHKSAVLRLFGLMATLLPTLLALLWGLLVRLPEFISGLSA